MTLDGGDRGYPLDVDGDGVTDLAVLRLGEHVAAARPRRLPVRARRTSSSGSIGGRDAGPSAFSATWEGDADAADARLRQLRRPGPTRASRRRLRRQRARPAGRGRDRPTPRRSALRRATARCRSCSATGTGPAAATCGSATTASTTAIGAGAAVADRPRRAAARRTRPADGWASMRIWGMGIASQDLTGDGLPEVYLTSQGDNKLQTLLDGPARADLRRHRPRARRHGHAAVRRRRRRCRRPPGTRSSRT